MSRTSAEIETKFDETVVLGGFAFNLASNQLYAGDGTPVALRSQSARVLAMLAGKPGEVVSKSDLIDAIWGETFVTDDSLVQCITDIRKALGDVDHRIIQTLTKRGYRLNLATSENGPGVIFRSRSRGGFLALGVLAAIAVIAFIAWPDRGNDVAAAPSIAVLAFDDLSNGNDRGYLSDAISEGIITELSRFPEIRVIARNSSFKYRDAATDIRDIGKKLGATYVLEGSQQKYGNRLRVTYQLVDAASGNHILAGKLDRDLADLFVMQDDIVRSVAASVGRKLSHQPPPSSSMARVSALHYHLQANKLRDQFSRESTAEALRLNLLAVEADPTAPFGYIGLVYAYGAGYRRGWTDLDPDEAFRRARQSAEKAVKLDPANYSAHRAMAWVHILAGEPERAIARYRKAIELNPSASDTMAVMSLPLMSLGRFEEAIATIERAARIDPHYPDWFDWNLSWAQYILGNCETALRTYRRMANPSNLTRRTLAAIYVCLGRQAEAEATIAEFLEREPDYTIAVVRTYMEREFKKTAAVEHWMEDLRIAGLPE